MKKLLGLPLVLLSFCVIEANERYFLVSYDRATAEAKDDVSSVDTTLEGGGFRLFSFQDDGRYIGLGISYVSDNSESKICIPGPDCVSSFSAKASSFVEIGWDTGRWTPFIGLSFTSSEVRLMDESDREESRGLSAGSWLQFDTFLLRGAVAHIDDEDNRAISGGVLYPVRTNLTLGGEIGLNLNSKVDGFNISIQIGRKF
ncbi:MAG: hypothetical protein OXH31_06035 [Gammaproteobacteria bacterium]|nr:hypothetical protein [Gammaproteobacteria bacterium]